MADEMAEKKPTLLAGGNPQIPKAEGDALPGWVP